MQSESKVPQGGSSESGLISAAAVEKHKMYVNLTLTKVIFNI